MCPHPILNVGLSLSFKTTVYTLSTIARRQYVPSTPTLAQ
jgi:hypothetical protein